MPYATMTDPQSLNLYSYVRNNPVTSIDADGHDFRSPAAFDWNIYWAENNYTGTQYALAMAATDADTREAESALIEAAQQQQSSSSTANANPNAAAEQHQYDLVVERANKLVGTDDAADDIDPDGKLVGGNYEFSINNNDKSDTAFRNSLNSALGEAARDKGAHSGHGLLWLQPPSHRVGFSTSLHHYNDALHVDHFNGGVFPIGTALHFIVDYSIGSIFYGSNRAFSYSGVQ